MQNDTTDFQKLAMTAHTALNPASAPATAFGSIIRPTPMERATGRLMRAPDHDEADTSTVLTDEVDAPADDTEPKDEPKGDAPKDEPKGDEPKDEPKDDEPKNEFLGAPEGDYTITGLPKDVEIDKAVVDALTPVAKEIGLSDTAMSKLAGVYNDKVLPHLAGTIQSQIENQVALTRKEWHQETQAAVEGATGADGKKIEPLKGEDGQPVYDGKTLKEVQQVAARTLDRFGTPEFRIFLEESGLGNHEALVRFAYTVGKSVSEDKFPRGGSAHAKPSDAELFYGSGT